MILLLRSGNLILKGGGGCGPGTKSCRKVRYRLPVVRGRLVVRVKENHLLDGLMALLLQLFPLTVLPRVEPLPVAGVDRLRARGPGQLDDRNIGVVGGGPAHWFMSPREGF